MPLSVQILTPERVVYETDAAEYAAAPSEAGDLGVLPGHAALVAPMPPGEVRIETGDEPQRFAVSGGFLEVVNDHVQILARSAESRDEIDVARARAALRRAEERLAAKQENIDIARAEAALARALNRLRVAGALVEENDA